MPKPKQKKAAAATKAAKTPAVASNDTKTLLFFDTETTGIAKADVPFQFSFVQVKMKGDKIVHKEAVETFLIDPGKAPGEQASKVHGYYLKDFIGKPKFAQVWPAIKKLIDSSDVLVAHNASFDIRMMNQIIRQASGNADFDLAAHKDVFCTLKFARGHCEYDSNKLVDIVNAEGLDFTGKAHDAAGDTLSMLAVFEKWLKDDNIANDDIEIEHAKGPIPESALAPTPLKSSQVCSDTTGAPLLFKAPGASNNNAAPAAEPEKITGKKRARAG